MCEKNNANNDDEKLAHKLVYLKLAKKSIEAFAPILRLFITLLSAILSINCWHWIAALNEKIMVTAKGVFFPDM